MCRQKHFDISSFFSFLLRCTVEAEVQCWTCVVFYLKYGADWNLIDKSYILVCSAKINMHLWWHFLGGGGGLYRKLAEELILDICCLYEYLMLVQFKERIKKIRPSEFDTTGSTLVQ